MARILPDLLERGVVKPNRVVVMEDGSSKERVAAGLDLFRQNKVHGVSFRCEHRTHKVSTLE